MKKIIWIGSLILALLPLWGREKIWVIHSDKLYLSKVQDEQVMRLEGKVHFWYGKTEFKSDRALIFDLQKIARLDGNVKVNNDSLSLAADSLTYYRIPDELKNKEPKDIKAELGKTQKAFKEITARVSDELYRQRAERSKEQER